MGITTDTGRGGNPPGSGSTSEIEAANSPDGKYHIYSSNAGKTSSAGIQILGAGTSTDKFVSSLKDKVIILEKEPEPFAAFDNSDEWAKWLARFDPNGKLSLRRVAGVIQSFQFEFTTPWAVTFSSTIDALKSSFGAPDPIGPTERIPAPGLNRDNILVCGLDLLQIETSQTEVSAKVGDLFRYAGLGDTVPPSLPPAVAGLLAKLNVKTADKKRNALWFNPSPGSKATVRLQFELGETKALQDALGLDPIGFQIKSTDVVYKKVLGAAETAADPTGVDMSQVTFSAKCSVGSTPAVEMIAGIEFQKSTITLTLQLNSRSGLVALSWLAGLMGPGGSLDVVRRLLEMGGVFSGINLRRMTIVLDTAENAGKPIPLSFTTDIEVSSATLGHRSDSNPVVFLATYIWKAGDGSPDSIQGQFWDSSGLSNDRDLIPYYEDWTDLKPINTLTPAASINLVKLIPKEKPIENIPDCIPTDITKASVHLSEGKFTIRGTITAIPKSPGSVPQPSLGQVELDASYAWGEESGFSLGFGINARLQLSGSSKHKDPATLIGRLDYSSSLGSWELKATLGGLYASALYEFFDASSATHVMPLIDSIEIKSVTLDYKYASKESGSKFQISGQLLVAALELDLTLEYEKDWTFSAVLKPRDAQATLGDIIASIVGDSNLDLPDFLASMEFGGAGATDTLRIDVHKEKPKQGSNPGAGGTTGGSFHFITEVTIGRLALTFAQYRSSDWSETMPSKRMVKVALTKLPEISVPLVGNLTQPFDEMYYLWIQDQTVKSTTKLPGLTRKEIQELNTSLADKLVPKDKFKEKGNSDVLIGAGSHFAVVIKSSSGERTCILDYDFMKPKSKPSGQADGAVGERQITTGAATDTDAKEDGGSSAHAPFKKKAGPLSISNIGLKYSEKKLRVMFDATFELGPISFSLLGFSINLKITSLDRVPEISASIQGLSAAYEKPPLTIAGIIRHGNTGTLDYYSGGLIIGWVPYEFQAAGFYGRANPPGGSPFTSVFIFARLDGPLVTLEFAEISGVTGGFGYMSDIRIPTAEQVVDFPFIATQKLGEGVDSALKALEKLTTPDPDGWFKDLKDTYWAAAGMKVSAFKILALDAVVVVQFGTSTKLGIFAVGIVDIPDAESPWKYAHVELGIAVVVDFDYGVLKAEAQLSPNSYILHPDCHLTGGFGFYYWFDAPHADESNVGNFVLTLGGYHQAFKIPDGYPNPPRLGISWSLGRHLSVKGEAYFAITPKACMGGGRLHAVFSAGPIEAFFDAFADFLINYKPFHFTAAAGVAIGVRFNIDLWFIHTHISAEISADLYLWGPPLAGRVHVDFWVTGFDINFGDSEEDVPPVKLVPFYELVLQSSSQQTALKSTEAARIEDVTETVKRPKNEGHVFLARSGLMNDSESPQREPNAMWTVRGGAFSFVVSCKMAIDTAKLGKQTINYTTNEVYAKPMKLTQPMSSTLTVKFTQRGVSQGDAKWGMEEYIKSLPSGLWAKYSADTDPSGGQNHIGDLLNGQDGGVPLMAGVLLTAPGPTMAPDKLPTFNIEDAQLQELDAEKNFPPEKQSHPEWVPVAPLEGEDQWRLVHDKWKAPVWGTGDEGQAGFVSKWAEAFKWGGALSQFAAIPKRLEKGFLDLYVAAPLVAGVICPT